MKRVETIHINGIVFSIENDAFAKLGAYLDALNKNFEQEQGGREIIADIEARISELFTEREGARQVITMTDVAKVIETLGTPEDIAGADADPDSSSNTESETEAGSVPPPRPAQQAAKSSRRLYRDPDRRYLGGICSGIAAWLGAKPAIIRLIFILFLIIPFHGFMSFMTFGIGNGAAVLVYFLLWIIVPKAKTTAQKLEMRGEPVNISNIEKNIRETFSDPTLKHSFRDFLNEAGEFFGKVFGIFGRIIGILLGLGMFCLGISLAIGLIVSFFMQNIIFNHLNVIDWDFLSFTELLQHIISPASYIILVICAIVTVVMVIFAFLFWGVKLMVGFHVKHKLLHVMLFVLWLAAIVTGIGTCVAQASNFYWRNDYIAETRLLAPSDTLFLAMAPSNLQISNNPLEVYFDKDHRCFYGKPNLNIRKSDNGQIKLMLERESQGESKRAAYRYAENISYSVDVRDSLLIFDPFFTVVPQNKWKFQTLDMTLYVPVGTVIIFDKTMFQNRIYRAGVRWYWNSDNPWVMTEKRGLQKK